VLTITSRIRKHATTKWKAKADATDRELRTLIGQKLMSGDLTAAQLKQINAGEEPTPAAPPKKKGKADPAPAPKKKSKAARLEARKRRQEEVDRQVRRTVKSVLKRSGVGPRSGDINPAAAFSKGTRIRVKEAAEQYSTSRKGAVYPQMRKAGSGIAPHPLAGMPARCGDTNLDHPSDRDKAVALAWTRYMAHRSTGGRDLPRWLRMTDHDRELVMYAAHNEPWIGRLEDRDSNVSIVKRRKLSPTQIKTLLDDSVSGGIEITPVVFDDALILTPVLYGELFPHVRVETIARGRRVKGASVVNPEFTSGVGEGTAITPFNTSAYVSAFDSAVYPAVASIELGQDFEEDSVVDLGGQVVEQFGLKALEWLDRVIAVGNGYNEPQGIFNATAATLVNSTFGAGGPPTVSDYEGLMFNVAKQFRTEAGAYLAYVSNDYTYRKAVSIPVGPGDERRVFGMDHASYRLLQTDYKVQNNIPDGYAAYVNLRRYRMYRRLGMQVRVETGGRQLALSNTRLIVVRMRYAGQLELGGAAALCKDMQVM